MRGGAGTLDAGAQPVAMVGGASSSVRERERPKREDE
jgi:hypothetical protein